MSGKNESTLAAIHQFGRFYLTIFPKCPLPQIDHVIIDTNVAKHLAALIDGEQSIGPNDQELLRYLRVRDINGSFAALEMSWEREKNTFKNFSDYSKPKGAGVAESLEKIAQIKNATPEDFDKFCDGKVDRLPTKTILNLRDKNSLAFGLSLEDYYAIITQNQLSIAILFSFIEKRPGKAPPNATESILKKVVDDQILAYKQWFRIVRGIGVGISAEIRLLAILFFFHGHILGLKGNEVRFEDITKLDQASKIAPSRLARNIAFDLTLITAVRQIRMGYVYGEFVPRRISAVLSEDRDLAAIIAWTLKEEMTPYGIHSRYKWPIESDFTKLYPEEFAYEGFLGRSRQMDDLVAAHDLLPKLVEYLRIIDNPNK